MPERTVSVASLSGVSYPVVISGNALAKAGEFIRERVPSGVAIVADEKAAELHLQRLLDSAGESAKKIAVVTVPSGEASKSLSEHERIASRLLELGFKRDSLVVAFGGGVVGDLAGFVASTLLRGIDFCQIPTTLLAQVDASVGGKTGVNHPAGKNLIGTFHQPKSVFCDMRTLDTLPRREYFSGMAEIVKCGLAFDEQFFSWLESNVGPLRERDYERVAEAIGRAVSFKAKIVREDEFDKSGARALLNLGHTFAHAIERSQGYEGLLHGEAVSVGLVAAAKLSEELLGFPATATERIKALLQSCGLPVKFPGSTEGNLVSSMASDKKFDAAGNKFVLLERIGKACLESGIDEETIGRAIQSTGFTA